MSDGLLLVLDRRELRISVENRTVRVDEPDGHFRRFPPALLQAVVIQGAPEVRCDVWRLLAEHNVPATLLPSRGRGEPAWMGAGLSASVAPRQAQYAAATRPEQRLALARELVLAKLSACRDVLAWREERDEVLLEQLQQQEAAVEHSHDLAALLGVEGTAARHWFAGLQARIPEHWGFQGRNRRPPRDPVNALLSLGYTLLATLAQARVEATGLDPWRGFLHEPVAGLLSDNYSGRSTTTILAGCP